MPDYYQIPALILTALLLPAFGHLYLRFRDTRSLLWFLGFLFAIFRMILFYRLGSWDFANGDHPWMLAAGQGSILISSALFLASLSPLRFRLGRLQILYVIPFTLPMVAYTILFHGVFHGKAPSGPLFLIFPALGLLSLIAGLFWAIAKGTLPVWAGVLCCVVAGIPAFWLLHAAGPGLPLTFVECCNHAMTAVLLISVFRRMSTGMILSVIGFALWASPIFLILPVVSGNAALDTGLTRAIVLGKVVAAIGMILLALEDQLVINKAAKEREQRARRETEAYSGIALSRRRVEDFDRQATEICEAVVKHSRFSKAALLFQTAGKYHLAGTAGMSSPVVAALDELARRIPVDDFLAQGTVPCAVEHSNTFRLSLDPWLSPGDDLKRLYFTSVLAIPMAGRTVTEGALFLGGMRNPPAANQSTVFRSAGEPLSADDLLPLEMLAARLQAKRSQTIMLEKLIDAEKFAGLGQLAGNVTQQLNNPLTVILGYASLLDETGNFDPQERKGIESILTEARRMRNTLESLTRIARHNSDQLETVSVHELLADMEELHRTEFLHRSIDFRMNVAPSLPKVLCRAQPLRQAVLHCLQFAIEAVESQDHAPATGRAIDSGSSSTKSIRLEATSEGHLVQILVAHSGPGFLRPDRAFDPYVRAHSTGDTTGLGLSLCATILRDQNGRAAAVNLDPHGAAVILELQAAAAPANAAVPVNAYAQAS
jgi:signal transduction histidine kinase